MSELIPFSWIVDKPNEDMYSSVYNKLLTDGRSSMTEEDCVAFGEMTGAIDVEEQIQDIKDAREELIASLKETGVTTKVLGKSFDDYAKDAFPYECMFVVRY